MTPTPQQSPTAVQQAGQIVQAPLPARVLRVLVRAGDSAVQGQVLAVLEAMKMENEIRCPRDGTVVEVHVAAGQAVQPGDRLVTVG